MPDPDTSAVPPLRIHQREALEALACAWGDADHPRAWVVLPPGAGKTRVGLEAVAGELRAHPDTRAVVLAPNTAIQSQWVAEARTMGLDASDDKSLISPLTCLTYQSLAVFDSEAADDDDSTTPVVDRLHPNGVALFERIRTQTAPGARPRRVPPPARGVGAAARRAARRSRPRPRPGAHRDTAREPRRRAARPRRPALREHPLPRLGAGGGEGGSPRAVRRARLADHPHA